MAGRGRNLLPAPLSRKEPMPRTEFIATGFHVPERVVTNDDLAKIMDTSDEWITQRSGIKTRHWVSDGETGATLARSEEHTSELQSHSDLVCRLLLEKKKK